MGGKLRYIRRGGGVLRYKWVALQYKGVLNTNWRCIAELVEKWWWLRFLTFFWFQWPLAKEIRHHQQLRIHREGFAHHRGCRRDALSCEARYCWTRIRGMRYAWSLLHPIQQPQDLPLRTPPPAFLALPFLGIPLFSTKEIPLNWTWFSVSVDPWRSPKTNQRADQTNPEFPHRNATKKHPKQLRGKEGQAWLVGLPCTEGPQITLTSAHCIPWCLR